MYSIASLTDLPWIGEKSFTPILRCQRTSQSSSDVITVQLTIQLLQGNPWWLSIHTS
uniref:Uncharacterized protein n=1 Tax=Anguilla anguilla TaxID=7936 RepID=A0A0E9SN77_ANGAN